MGDARWHPGGRTHRTHPCIILRWHPGGRTHMQGAAFPRPRQHPVCNQTLPHCTMPYHAACYEHAACYRAVTVSDTLWWAPCQHVCRPPVSFLFADTVVIGNQNDDGSGGNAYTMLPTIAEDDGDGNPNHSPWCTCSHIYTYICFRSCICVYGCICICVYGCTCYKAKRHWNDSCGYSYSNDCG